jgi:hypothetical protein
MYYPIVSLRVQDYCGSYFLSIQKPFKIVFSLFFTLSLSFICFNQNPTCRTEDFDILLNNPLLLICSRQHEKYFRGIYLKDIRTKLKDKKIRGKKT